MPVRSLTQPTFLSCCMTSRHVWAIADDTIVRLHDAELIVGLKDATADLSRPTRLRARRGDAFMQWSGDDATAPAYRAMGGHGCISVTANVALALCVPVAE